MKIVIGSIIVILLLAAVLWWSLSPIFRKTGEIVLKKTDDLRKIINDHDEEEAKKNENI
jgi:hypothetical protein